MCATTHNAATPIDHAGSPLVLLLFTVLPVGSCVGRSRAGENASQNLISWHQGKHANKNPPETIHVECQCESGRARSNWPLRRPWHDPAAPILLTAHTSWNLPPLSRVSHCTESAVMSVKHLGKLKQASMLKSGPISKQQKGSIFSIWFAPLRHSLSHSQSYWEQSCILTGVVHIHVCKALPCQCCHCWERTLLL